MIRIPNSGSCHTYTRQDSDHKLPSCPTVRPFRLRRYEGKIIISTLLLLSQQTSSSSSVTVHKTWSCMYRLFIHLEWSCDHSGYRA